MVEANAKADDSPYEDVSWEIAD